jgi:hypothetical protein
MSGNPPQEHWFDRLAAPQTRPQFLKAALAGAALTLPFARSAAARAVNTRSSANPCNAKPGNGPTACRKGCFRTSNMQALRRLDVCRGALTQSLLASEYLLPVFSFVSLLQIGIGSVPMDACVEAVILRQKAMQRDCLYPNCPGFDPCGPDGPCADCANVAGASCCPSTDVFGYSCCAQCCAKNGDGCGSGVTECGGGTAP